MTIDFAAKAARMTNDEIFYALKDIKATLDIHRDAPADDPYARKLWAEWDAMLDEQRKRTDARPHYRRRGRTRRD